MSLFRKLREKEIEIPFADGPRKVIVREMTGKDLLDYQAACKPEVKDGKETGGFVPDAFLMICFSVLEVGTGIRVFKNADAGELAEAPLEAIRPLLQAQDEVNGRMEAEPGKDSSGQTTTTDIG